VTENNDIDAETTPSELPAVEQKAAEEAAAAFLMAVKNYGLFPPHHASTVNMLGSLCRTLNLFIKEYGDFRFDIEKKRLVYNDEVIFVEDNPDENPAFIFFRDGIRWLEFIAGLEEREIVSFFQVVNKYKIIADEPEGDLVTDLWSADLPHINYEASDELWEAEPVLEFSLLNPDAHEFMDYGGASAEGFDLLKSMLGIDSADKDQTSSPEEVLKKVKRETSVAGGKAGKDGAVSGTGSSGGGEEGDGSGVTGDGSDGGGAGGEDTGTGSGLGVFSGVGEGDGSGVFSDAGEGDGSGVGFSAGTGTLEASRVEDVPVAEEVVEDDDFWSSLKTVGESAEQDTVAGGAIPGTGSGKADPGVAGGKKPTTPGKSAKHGLRGSGAGGKGESVVGDSSPATPVDQKRASADSRPGHGGDWDENRSYLDDDYISVSVASVEVGHSLWNFTREEQRTLEMMVKDHEEKSNDEDVVELLMIILREEVEPHIFSSIINFLKEEFRIFLIDQNFRLAHEMLLLIKEMRQAYAEEKEWSVPLLNQYFEDVSEPEVMDALLPVWPELPNFDQKKLRDFASVLQMLPPKTGESLVPMFTQIEFGKGRRIIIDLIASFVSRDLEIMERMLDRPEEDLTLRLISVLRGLKDQALAEKMLCKVIKHPKEKVRKEACEILISRESRNYDKLFQLIHDSSIEVQELVFNYFGSDRTDVVEQLLVDYMCSERFLRQAQPHILSCYKTLGLCGSDKSVPMLDKILFGQPWNFVVGTGTKTHRQGAALALAKIRTATSLKLLNKAEESSMPHIRAAWQKATGQTK